MVDSYPADYIAMQLWGGSIYQPEVLSPTLHEVGADYSIPSAESNLVFYRSATLLPN
jgi:hypothetical protein